MKDIFYTASRAEWRQCLSEIYQTSKEIWFVFPNKASGEPCLSYNDAVEEALCFGWIDGQAGTLDSLHGLRRFTPRRPGSPYSQPNIERLRWLEQQGLLFPEVREQVRDLLQAPFVYPEDILEAIHRDAEAWAHYQQFTEPYKRIRIAYIDAARQRPEEFDKRLNSFITKTHAGKLIIGYGGIDKYYQ